MNLLDSSTGKEGRDVVLTRLYRHGDDTIRIRIRRNSYSDQSYAMAYLLNAHKEWTELLSEPPASWHDQSYSNTKVLETVATNLSKRAAKVLGPRP